MIIQLDYKNEQITYIKNNNMKFIDMIMEDSIQKVKEYIERYYNKLEVDKIIINKKDKIIETHTKNHIRLLYY